MAASHQTATTDHMFVIATSLPPDPARVNLLITNGRVSMGKAKPRAGDRHVGTAKTIRFTDEQEALLDALKAETGGTYADAIAAAARAFLGRNDRRADVALELRRMADQVEAGR